MAAASRHWSSRSTAAVAVVCAAVLALAACEKIEERPAPPGKLDGAAKVAVDFIPDENSMMVGASFAQLTQSPLWKALEPKLLGMAEVKDVLAEVKTECQIDLVADLGTVVAALPSDMDESRTVMVLQGKWDKAKVDACVQKLVAKYGGGAQLTIAEDDGLTVLSGEAAGGSKMYLAWLAPDTFAFTNASLEGDPALLRAVAKKERPLARNDRFMGLVARVNTGDAFWMVADRQPGNKLFNVPGADDVNGFFFDLALDRAAVAYMGFRFASAGAARREARGAKRDLEREQKGTYKDWLADSRVYLAGSDLIFDVRVPRTRIDALADQLASMSEAELQTQLVVLASKMGGL